MVANSGTGNSSNGTNGRLRLSAAARQARESGDLAAGGASHRISRDPLTRDPGGGAEERGSLRRRPWPRYWGAGGASAEEAHCGGSSTAETTLYNLHDSAAILPTLRVRQTCRESISFWLTRYGLPAGVSNPQVRSYAGLNVLHRRPERILWMVDGKNLCRQHVKMRTIDKQQRIRTTRFGLFA